MGDLRWWPWCGNNPQFDRINVTSGWAPQCDASSTHYHCTIACCVSTWQNTSDATPGSPTGSSTSYSWLPPSADFSPDGPIPGPFLTQRPDGSVYKPSGVDFAEPFTMYTATAAKVRARTPACARHLAPTRAHSRRFEGGEVAAMARAAGRASPPHMRAEVPRRHGPPHGPWHGRAPPSALASSLSTRPCRERGAASLSTS